MNLEHILTNANDGIFIVDQHHCLVLFNRACEELYGISREDVVDKACWKLNDFQDSLKQASKDRGSVSYGELAPKKEITLLPHKNGRQVWVETSYTPIFDDDNHKVAYVMGVIKDISEFKRIEEEKESLQRELSGVRRELERRYDFSKIVGRSPQIVEALTLAGEVAKENTTVILVGESGTGKELVARAIHYNSPRRSKPFVALNCSAFPDTLIESELFGYEKGAFTGAEKTKPGKVQLASGGTLFLDEVTELSAPAQAKILRLIQEREYEPLGSVKSVPADIRIIAATNKDLAQLVKDKQFREDLYYRLFVYPIVLPALRERAEDIPILVEHILHRFNHDMAKRVEAVAPEAMEVLQQHSWPGNVRELQNVMERLMILSQTGTIQVSDLPRYLLGDRASNTPPHTQPAESGGMALAERVRDYEEQMILDALQECSNNKTRAARKLGLTRSTFRYKLSRIQKKLRK